MNAEREEVGVGLFKLNISGERDLQVSIKLHKSKEENELNRFSEKKLGVSGFVFEG